MDGVIDAINQMFAEFELVYHNQFNKAFPTAEKLMYAKRLWMSNLSGYSASQILGAAKQAMCDSEYLPTIRGILKYLESALDQFGLPDAHTAYIEACRAPSPKSDFQWSHPAVYFAGVASDWFFLSNNTEAKAFPVFERNYQMLCERVLRGEQLDMPLPPALEQKVTAPLPKEEQQERMKQMRKDLGI